jgi:hypothetical protein
MHKAFSEMLGSNFKPADFAPGRYNIIVDYFSWTLHVANAISEAVANHVRESRPDAMPDLSDPAVIVRTLYSFFGGRITENDGLELVLIPEGQSSDHHDIIPGKKYSVGYAYLLNACAIMLGVPTYTKRDDAGRIRNFTFVEEYYFRDAEGLERWLKIRAARKAA